MFIFPLRPSRRIQRNTHPRESSREGNVCSILVAVIWPSRSAGSRWAKAAEAREVQKHLDLAKQNQELRQETIAAEKGR